MPAFFCSVLVISSLAYPSLSVAATRPRSERVTERIVERTYARQSIAEARAARAEARVAAIAPVAPVPPPPRPATVRRMARAGVPPIPSGAPAPRAVARTSPGAPAPVNPAPVAAPHAVAKPDAQPATNDSIILPNDGTRSVLTAAEEPLAETGSREPAGPAVTHPPIELLPTP